MDKGIILIGIGDYYQQLAYNLLKSIRAHSPSIEVALITDDTANFLDEFDYVIEPQLCHYIEDKRINPFKLKTFINLYTPFDKTIYLDVDSLCLKPIDDLFKYDFLIQEVGRYNYESADDCHMVWVKKAGLTIRDIYDAYHIPKDSHYPEYNSSFILFSKEHDNYFKVAQEAYMDRRIAFKDIGGRYPDELAWNLASALTKTYNKVAIKPIFFQWESKIESLTEITSHFSFLGMAGGYHSTRLKNMYQIIVKNLNTPFKHWHSNKKIFHQK